MLKKTLRALLTAAVLLVPVTVVQAQTTDSQKQNTAFTIQATHDGIDTDGYNLYINGALAQTKAVAYLVNGTISFQYPAGLPKGTYVFYVEAFGPGGATASVTLTLTVTAGNPSAPGQPKKVNGVVGG